MQDYTEVNGVRQHNPITRREFLPIWLPAYIKKPEEIETLGSSSVKKCFDILSGTLSAAKERKFVAEIPEYGASGFPT